MELGILLFHRWAKVRPVKFTTKGQELIVCTRSMREMMCAACSPHRYENLSPASAEKDALYTLRVALRCWIAAVSLS